MADQDDGILPGRQLLFQRSEQRAYTCLNDRQYSRAFAHFIVALTIDADIDDTLLDAFLYTLGRVTDDLEVEQNWNEVLMCYQQSLELLPYNPNILHGLATVLFRLGHIESAIKYFQKAYRENPFFTPSLYCIDNLKNALVERWHYLMLNDKGRNSAYSEAIYRAVEAGYHTVLDIGAGSGILSMIAADAGAKKVYACEGNQMMFRILERVVEANAKTIELSPKLSHDLDVPDGLPERVMLVVTEIFDAGLFGEHVLSTLKHAWEYLIENGETVRREGSVENLTLDDETGIMEPRARCPGKVIPHSATLWAVPIECERIREQFWLNKEVLEAFEIAETSVVATINQCEPYTTERLRNIPGGYKCLSLPKPMLNVNFNNVEDITSLLNGREVSEIFELTESGRIDSIAVWFDLHLDGIARISTGPHNETGCWEQSIFCVLPKHLQEYSPYVNIAESVEVTFCCKGHLTLQSIRTSSPQPKSVPKSASMDSFAIHSLNSYYKSNILSMNLGSKVIKDNSVTIDISSFPSVGLKMLKDGAQKLLILPTKFMRDVHELQILSGISQDKLRIMSYEDICARSIQCSMVICEPVEKCGLLKKNIFEDIALLRTLCLKQPPVVFPRKISIFAVLADSPDLLRQAKVISDENCLGYKISQFLNDYGSVIQQDIQISTLSYEKLCNAVKLCDIQLNELCLEKSKLQSFVEFRGSVKVLVTKSGEVSAIPFWFSLDYEDNCKLDTSCPKSLWSQAAIISETKVAVQENEYVSLEWTCRNSCLNISVKAKSSD